MTDEKTGLWLSRDELHGVPESLLNRLIEGEQDGEHAGLLWLPTKGPFSSSAISSATLPATRKKIHYAIVNRMPQNIDLVREMVLLRDETARMLGWPDHFTSKTSQKMVEGPEFVVELMSEILREIIPVAEGLAVELKDIRIQEAQAREENPADTNVFFWDREFLQSELDKKEQVIQAEVSEYFELEKTLRKLFDIYEELFSVRLVAVENAASSGNLVWHNDVRMFAAWNTEPEEAQFLAYVYLDLFPRPGKYGHVGQYTLQRRYLKADGSWFDPCSVLVMNYSEPTQENPTLLRLQDLRKLFHELGHMYHCVLSRAQYARLHSVDSDFVEAPSLVLEQFFRNRDMIKEVSYHYSYISSKMRQAWIRTLERSVCEIPDRSIQLSDEQAALLAKNHVKNNVRLSLNDIFFATYDILIHSPKSHEDLKRTSLSELFNKTRVAIHRLPGAEEQGEGWNFGQGQTVFRAIQGKYDAGYYAYVLERIFALDIFRSGFSNNLMNKANSHRYRDMILCKGGSQPEIKTLTDYLGHKPITKPYFDWLGIESPRSGTSLSS